jgi:hypothetical protein
MWRRTVILILSAWLLFSGYAWPHSRANLINNWFVGIGLLIFGALAMAYDWARYATLAFGVWLFAFTALSTRNSPSTFWNDAMVAFAVFLLSLVGRNAHRTALDEPIGGAPSRAQSR